MGASIVSLCPQRPEFNASITEELGLTFPVLQDRENEVASRFGLTLSTPPQVIEAEQFLGLDLPAHNGTDHWDLPIPSRFIIDRSFVIRRVEAHVDHRLRTEPSASLEALEKIAAQTLDGEA